MPPSTSAVKAWAELNERQRTFMRVIYSADQRAEELAKGAWGRGEQARPASEWRWLEYGPVGGVFDAQGPLQERLAALGERDSGSGSTLKALEQRGLIITESRPAVLAKYTVWVQLTKVGRAACRAGGCDPERALQPKRGQLSEALWGMLVDVHAAGPGGFGVTYADGAWERLTEREPEPFVSIEANPDPAPPGGRYRPYLLRLTDIGRDHYEQHWEAYGRLYPRVDAPRPDGTDVWPAAVDQALKELRAAAWATSSRLRETLDEAARLGETTANRAEQTQRPELVRLLARRNKAADVYDAAVAKAAARYRQFLEEQAAELAMLYRRAAVRYVLAAAATLDAAVAGGDPGEAVTSIPESTVATAVEAWPWAPEQPVTGVAEVDASLEEAHRAMTGAPLAPPKRNRRANKVAETKLPVEPEAARLVAYGTTLALLVEGGQLVRLLSRAART